MWLCGRLCNLVEGGCWRAVLVSGRGRSCVSLALYGGQMIHEDLLELSTDGGQIFHQELSIRKYDVSGTDPSGTVWSRLSGLLEGGCATCWIT